MKSALRVAFLRACALLFAATSSAVPPNGTSLFENLTKLGSSFTVDDPGTSTIWAHGEGPKGVATADFDLDGLHDIAAGSNDGRLSVLFGKSGASFELPVHYAAGDNRGLRDVIAANVFGDARPEIIVAHPFEGKLYIFQIAGTAGSRVFASPATVLTWPGARAVAAGDFNGDGKMDLAVGGAGLGFREFRGDGTGVFEPMPLIGGLNAPPSQTQFESARPVFSLHVWRKVGDTRDQVAMAMAGYSEVHFFKAPTPGAPLALTSLMPGSVYLSSQDLAMGFVTPESRLSGVPDLITTEQDEGDISVRTFQPGIDKFPVVANKRINVQGGPRALALADVNGDTWPDLLVAARYGNSVSIFRNINGTFELASRTPAGASPRDLAVADFDGNGSPDVAAINRESQDVTMHRIDPGTGFFFQSALVLELPALAHQAHARDLDGDGRDEIIYTAWRSNNVYIRKLTPTGLGSGGQYSMGGTSTNVKTADLNADGRPDLLAFAGWNGLSIRYRLQLPDHTFGDLVTLNLPAEIWHIRDLLVEDFTQDGKPDCVVLGYNRISLFEITPSGLLHRRSDPFPSYPETVIAVDTDQDGDLDVATFSGSYSSSVLENTVGWRNGTDAAPIHTSQVSTTAGFNYFFSAQSEGDVTGDGDPDVSLLGWDSNILLRGGPGHTFQLARTALQGVLAGVTADFDGDGRKDGFGLSPSAGRTLFYPGIAGQSGVWGSVATATFPTPSTNLLITGDFDGDDRPDLAGLGSSLWLGLSATAAPPPVPAPIAHPPIEIQRLTINEVITNTEFYVPPGMASPVDCIELYNGSGTSVDLTGWRLRLVAPLGEVQRPDFVFPGGLLASGQRVVVYCTGNSSATTASFKLPATGGTLRLLAPDATETESLAFPAMDPDISYARVTDGSSAFYRNPMPSIGGPNYDNGTVPARLQFRGMDMDALKAGIYRFRVAATAEFGWGQIWIDCKAVHPGGAITYHWFNLNDAGSQGDAVGGDGIYSGELAATLPNGTQLEFFAAGYDYFEYRVIYDRTDRHSLPGQPITNYTLALPTSRSGWEISEIVSNNVSGLLNSAGEWPDWAELRFTGAGSGSTAGLFLADSLFGDREDNLYALNRMGSTLSVGDARVILLDGTPVTAPDAQRAPFRVDNDGDTIYLFRRLPSGVRELVDWVKAPPLAPDVAFARLGPGGDFVQSAPTPGMANVPPTGVLHRIPLTTGNVDAVFSFAGAGRVQASDDLVSWTNVSDLFPDIAIEHTYREPIDRPKRFFRVAKPE